MATGKDRRAALRELAEQIRAVLARGLPQDQASLDAVCAALAEPDARAALARLAADPEAAEHAPLVALLLSPGPSVQRELEPALGRAGVRPDEVCMDEVEPLADLVANLMAENPPQVRALLPDGSQAALAADAQGLRGFVRRLRPAATAPEELRAVLARRCAPEQALELAVLLRHCRLAWTPARVFFLATLLERANIHQDDLPGLVAWATDFLEDCAPEPDFRRELAARRQALLAQLRQAEFMEEALARGNYETLMAQGLRLAHVHGPDVRAALAHLERAGLLALGLAGESLDQVSVRDLGHAADAEDLLRLLPGLLD